MRETEFGARVEQHGDLLRPNRYFSQIRSWFTFGISLILVALLLRVIAAVALEQVLIASGGDGFLALDDRSYDLVAWQQTQHWLGLGDRVPEGERYLLNVYTYTEAALYLVVGHQPLAMKLLNCLFGALTAGLIFLMTRRIFGEVAGRVSGIVAALFPSTFLWSITNLKDTMAGFFIALALWLLTELIATARWRYILPLLLALAVIGGLRAYLPVILGPLIPLSVLIQSRLRFPGKWPTALLLAIGVAVVVGLSGQQFYLTTIDRLNQQRFLAAIGAQSSYVPTAAPVPTAPVLAAVSTPPAARSSGNVPAAASNQPAAPPPRAVPTQVPASIVGDDSQVSRQPIRSLAQWLPTGIAYVLAAPFPWAADRRVEQVVVPEVLLWMAMIALATIGLAFHWRKWTQFAHILAYCGGMLLVLASTQGNLGTMVRHRGMLIPFALVFSGAGAAWIWRRWQESRVSRGEVGRSGPIAEMAPELVAGERSD